MGDVGDYWRDHREWGRDKKRADALGISVETLRRREENARHREARQRGAAKAAALAASPYACPVCDKRFMDANGLRSHSSATQHPVRAVLRRIERETPTTTPES